MGLHHLVTALALLLPLKFGGPEVLNGDASGNRRISRFSRIQRRKTALKTPSKPKIVPNRSILSSVNFPHFAVRRIPSISIPIASNQKIIRENRSLQPCHYRHMQRNNDRYNGARPSRSAANGKLSQDTVQSLLLPKPLFQHHSEIATQWLHLGLHKEATPEFHRTSDRTTKLPSVFCTAPSSFSASWCDPCAPIRSLFFLHPKGVHVLDLPFQIGLFCRSLAIWLCYIVKPSFCLPA